MPQQEVYADLYFLVNMSMDLLCLNLTAALLHRGVRRWRLLLASAVGGGGHTKAAGATLKDMDLTEAWQLVQKAIADEFNRAD